MNRNRKLAWAMVAVSLFVGLLDVFAMTRWPSNDMGGVIARMMILAVAAIQVVPLAGFAVLAFAHARQSFRRWFLGWTLVASPVLLFGVYVGISVLVRWGL